MISDDGDQILKDNLAILSEMHKAERIDDATYFKGVVCLAFEYAVNDSMASAVALLGMVPEVYYKLTLPTQLPADDPYWGIVSELASLLVSKGLAGLESEDVKPTQAPAKA